MFEWTLSIHNCMYHALVDGINKMTRKPDVLIVDFATYAAMDAAEHLGIPYGK
jgi:ribosomal protein S2